MSYEKFQNCIEACLECATVCENCATSCLREENTKMMASCILLDRQCAEICTASARVMAMSGGFSTQLCQLCAEVCEACARECEKHSHMEHCMLCAESCRNCAEECRIMVGEMA